MSLPPSVARVLTYFGALDRESKMQALLQYSRKLEPVPDRFINSDRTPHVVPECQTQVELFSERREGRLHYYAAINARQSPTVAAFLAIVFSAVNDQPPETTAALPDDFARQVMDGLGLAGREVGLTAIVAHVKRAAANAQTDTVQPGPSAA
jgi:cysteine desulfuration protein SufE